MRTYRSLCLVLFLSLALSACTTRSALVNLWIDADHPAGTMENLLVVALWQDPDERSVWEERFAEVLKRGDADVGTSYMELTKAIPDSAAVFREARRRGCDGVIVIHEHVEDGDSFYIPGFTTPRSMKSTRWYRVGNPSAWRTEFGGSGWSSLRCDVELWSSGERRKMVWSGTTEVIDPADDDHAANEAADTVASELARLGLVPSTL